jgi:hypothetical protein
MDTQRSKILHLEGLIEAKDDRLDAYDEAYVHVRRIMKKYEAMYQWFKNHERMAGGHMCPSFNFLGFSQSLDEWEGETDHSWEVVQKLYGAKSGDPWVTDSDFSEDDDQTLSDSEREESEASRKHREQMDRHVEQHAAPGMLSFVQQRILDAQKLCRSDPSIQAVITDMEGNHKIIRN